MSSSVTSFFGNMSVRKKLLIGFSLVLLITLATSVIGYSALQNTLRRYSTLQMVEKINLKLHQVRQLEKDFIIQGKEQSISDALAIVEDIQGIVRSALEVMTIPSTIELMTRIQADLDAYRNNLDRAVVVDKQMNANQFRMVEAARGAIKQFDALERHLTESALTQIRISGDQSSIRSLEHASLASRLARDVLTARRHEKDFIMRGDTQYADQLNAIFESIDSNAKALSDQLGDSATRATITSAREQMAHYRSEFDELRQSIQRNDQTEAEMAARAAAIVSASNDAYAQQRVLMQAQAGDAKVMITVAGSIGFVAGLMAALFISRLIVGPLQQAVQQALRVAAGDLSADIESNRKDELGQLMQAMQTMTESLRDLLKRLRIGIDQLAVAAEEMSSVTEQSSVGVTQQKLETEQVATAMSQMVATVTEVARNAHSAAASADQADQHVEQGNLVVLQAIERIENLAHAIAQSASAIEHLKHSSTNIGTVLDVIKSIAEQTNLLALNAAIEAARAGEAGRGFAVVADEVRALALRTQESTSQIEQLISTLQDGAEGAADMMTNSQNHAHHTVDAAKQAGAALRAINQSVSSIQQMNQQIAAAAEEQSSVAEEVNRSVSSIREVAEQAATATKATSTASIDLARLGGDLQLAVSRFKLE